MQYVAQKDYINGIVIGGHTSDHVRQNVALAQARIPDEVWEELEASTNQSA